MATGALLCHHRRTTGGLATAWGLRSIDDPAHCNDLRALSALAEPRHRTAGAGGVAGRVDDAAGTCADEPGRTGTPPTGARISASAAIAGRSDPGDCLDG